MSDVLILNADYRPLSYLPLSTIKWSDAVKLVHLNRIIVLEYYDDWEVHSPSVTMKVPALAVTKEYMKYKKSVRFSRKNLFLRDLYKCQYCGESFANHELTIDHVVPQSRGGKTTWENCVTCCQKCNSYKADSIMLPNRLPFKPEMWHLIGNAAPHLPWQIKHESWRPYLEISK